MMFRRVLAVTCVAAAGLGGVGIGNHVARAAVDTAAPLYPATRVSPAFSCYETPPTSAPVGGVVFHQDGTTLTVTVFLRGVPNATYTVDLACERGIIGTFNTDSQGFGYATISVMSVYPGLHAIDMYSGFTGLWFDPYDHMLQTPNVNTA
ncbi:MAG: hypothetical protein NVSMB52_13180 [Chloroflexota bacterium]